MSSHVSLFSLQAGAEGRQGAPSLPQPVVAVRLHAASLIHGQSLAQVAGEIGIVTSSHAESVGE
jgi:hypothetical protein